ncbi:aldo/keto reductase [Aggregatilinea lenta]|uniref:aldo/keto reductase n=1 Tax=Aggregatilinea lenta TaxID=913108 RepID=UPI0013C2A0C2|nr:aldo/keto reductase [Aggregatilinea lenta]
MSQRGCATPDATAAYARRMGGRTAEGHFRLTSDSLTVSGLGMGTLVGEPDDATDAAYQAAVERALAGGCNVIDTAINARHQRSERAVGQGLRAAIKRGDVKREEVVIATKGGFVPFDGAPPTDSRKWVYDRFIETGLAHPNDFAANYHHCLAPGFLDEMIALSRRNLDVDTIDVYCLHNPETQALTNTHDTFRRRMLDAFETLEAAVERGEIAAYGVSTWSALRVSPNAPDFLSLAELMSLAFEVAGEQNHFCYVQMPYNLMMTEAYSFTTQQVGEEFLNPIEAANQLGLTVMTGATLKQGLLATPFMADLSPYFPNVETDAQRAIQFARSTPGVTTALVGMRTAAHVDENLAVAQIPPTAPDVINSLFGGGD